MLLPEQQNDTDAFFTTLSSAGAISSLWKSYPALLRSIEPTVTQAALKLLLLYFSCIDDGNLCIPLDADIFMQKWEKKWLSLRVTGAEDSSPVTRELLQDGIRDLLTAPALLHTAESPFVTEKDTAGTVWLFTRRYYDAKKSIEKRMVRLFPAQDALQQEPTEAAINACIERISRMCADKSGQPFMLNREQAQAIVRGQNESLIITGGPGTGKTTVVCFLLWELLSKPAYENSALYLAAPSGKAADRMKESITGSLSSLRADEQNRFPDRFRKLTTVSPSTIHRLLHFLPAEGRFSYNSEHQFAPHSIFVIDEASMIDVTLFGALLEAVPDTARLFILGDKNQLPSVEAGAVLSDLLEKKKAHVVALTESKRFAAASEVGRLACALQADEPLHPLPFSPAATFTALPAPQAQARAYPVSYYEAKNKDDIRLIILRWTEAFYAQLSAQARALSAPYASEQLEALWKLANEARILTAERQGARGGEELNALIKSVLFQKQKKARIGDAHYAGELLMVTQNQKMYNLYNGDCGIVVSFATEEGSEDTMLYLMLQKESAETTSGVLRGEIFHIGRFMFYPLHYIAEESLESAYAITIHKSQGSGYNNILIFLPEQVHHPLLNRQLVYTAVTRTQGNTSIVASQQTLEAARKTVTTRDSLLML